MSLDEAVLRALNALAGDPAVATFAVVLSSRWMLVIVALTLVASSAHARNWRLIAAVALTVGLADVVSSRIVKPAVDRERPCRALSGLESPASCGVGKSFPSSHASTGFALAATTAPAVARSGWFLFPLAALVALSRVVLGVHYPSDVIAGAILGLAIGAAGYAAFRRSTRSLRSRAQPSPTEPDRLAP